MASSPRVDAYLVPTERPPRLLDVKLALLGYDTVYLPSPDDRELIPPLSYVAAAGMGIMPFGINAGPVLPLGKVSHYDEGFGELEAALKAAGSPDCVQVESTRAGFEQPGLTIGGVPIPPGWPDPALIFQTFRFLILHPDVVRAASAGLEGVFEWPREEVEALLVPGRGLGNVETRVDGEVRHSLPPIAPLDLDLPDEESRGALTHLSCARVGTAVKSLMVGHMEPCRVPFTSDEGVASVLRYMHGLQRIRTGQDPEVVSIREAAARAHEYAVGVEIDHASLEALSLKEVLRLRSKAWGEHHEARRAFVAEVERLASESVNVDEFRSACKKSFDEQRRTSDALRHEWKSLGLKTFFKLAQPATVATFASVVEQVTNVPSLTVLLASGASALVMLGAELNAAYDLQYKDRTQRASSALAVARPYEPFLRT